MDKLLIFASGLVLTFGFWHVTNKHRHLPILKVDDIVSWVINRYLLLKFPITSFSHTRPVPIPTCPYKWPDGQGDVAKFLEGEQRSSEWAQGLGKVYRIWSGMTPEIVLTSPEDVKTVFKDSDMHNKAVNNDAGWLMGEILGKCLGLISRDDWRRVHASVAGAFTLTSASASISRAAKLIEEHFSALHQDGKLNKGLLNPTKDLRLLPFWITAEHLYGTITPGIRDELQAMIPLTDSLFSRVVQGGMTRYSWFKYLPTKTNRDLKEFKERWRSFNDAIYAECASEKPNAPIVQIYKSIENRLVTRDQALQTLHEMLFANLDVTIGGLAWNPLFLAANQNVQAQIREEIRKTRAEATGKTPGWEDYLRRPGTLLAASVLESTRLKPAAAFSIPQSAPTDRVVGGFLVPAGTNFVVDTHSMNIKDPYWGANNTEYRPSRFMEGKAWDMRYHYWRFGFGPRQCLGKYLADFIIRSVVAHLVEYYHLGLIPTSVWDRNPDTWIVEPSTEIRCDKI
ncbi:putative cytochrome P450 monooxygenase [Xylariaceae sp. AK1471]|nr:putative cytochrome P450 monooxygenase [Xylariaceae sp. AK1471]